MTFKDYFSAHASDYARYRPHYPQALAEYLASLVSEHQTAWDCATGNGQVALQLVDYFQAVVATDASAAQLAEATQHDRIRYHRATAEQSGLPTGTIDLITVAQALHWFDLDAFYPEATRVLKPSGILAVWCYEFFTVSHESAIVNQCLHDFYQQVDPYWAPERQIVKDHYQTIPFPFTELATPPFSMTVHWTAEQLLGYLNTWSAVRQMVTQTGWAPMEALAERLTTAWGEPTHPYPVHWQIHLRVGRCQ